MWDIVFAVVMTSVAAVFFVMAVLISVRSHKVGRLRTDMLAKVSAAANEDIYTTPMRPWAWRYEMLGSVTYGDMVMSLKRIKPEAFYPDTAFLYSSDLPIIEEDP